MGHYAPLRHIWRLRLWPWSRLLHGGNRHLMTLAIETSCDDTAVAVVEKGSLNGGVHPLVSLQSHQENLASLVQQAIDHLPLSDWGLEVEDDPSQKVDFGSTADIASKRLPDFIAVTRGPGMRSNLSTGLDTAKGIAAAWRKPLVGVHHMQAHALTPRLMSALEACPSYDRGYHYALEKAPGNNSPEFPFLSLLVSGGHTLLIHSASLTDHHVMGSTNDIAIGECLDKVARVVLPREVLQTTKSTMYASLLENFAFADVWREGVRRQAEIKKREDDRDNDKEIASDSEKSSWFSTLFECENEPPTPPRDVSAQAYLQTHCHRYSWYEVPANHEEAARKSATRWGWAFNQPLTTAGGGVKLNTFEMSFSGLMTAAERVMSYGMNPETKKLNKMERMPADVSVEERQDIAREVMRAAFEHIASRVVLGLQSLLLVSTARPAVVMSGGVAANSFLRHILASVLLANGYDDVQLHFPAPEYCTDNAAMIGWAGLEMYEAGHMDESSIRALRRWPLDQLRNPPDDG